MVVSPSVLTVSSGISSLDLAIVGNSSKTAVSCEKMSFPVSSLGLESSFESVSAFKSVSVKDARIIATAFCTSVYLKPVCNKSLPARSVLNDGGNLADLRRAVNVTTSDLGKLGHPLHRLLTNTIRCFCRYNGTTKCCLSVNLSSVSNRFTKCKRFINFKCPYFVGSYVYGTLYAAFI